MKKTITLLTILLLVVFMVGCENSVNPIQPQTQNQLNIIDNLQGAAKPFVGQDTPTLLQKGPKGPKPQKPTELYVPNQYSTIQEAVDAANEGDVIFVGPGTFSGAVIDKGVELRGVGNPTINSGPLFFIRDLIEYRYGFRFLDDFSGNNAKISHFEFVNVAFPIFSRGCDNIVVEHCNFYNPIQGITNWGGNGWTITHNTIVDLQTLNGGGIGIFIGDRLYRSGGISGNIASYNTVKGTLDVWSGDGGGYDGTGIVLYSDERYGPGAESIFDNVIEYNKISLISNNPTVVNVNGIELTDSQNDEGIILIYDNVIKKNVLKDNDEAIAFTPLALEAANIIEKNIVN